MFKNIQKRSGISRNLQKHSETSRNLQEPLGTSKNLQESSETFRNLQDRNLRNLYVYLKEPQRILATKKKSLVNFVICKLIPPLKEGLTS